MRVLLLCHKMYVYGGAETLIVRMANHLSTSGVPNTILTHGMLPTIQQELFGTEVIIVPPKSESNRPWNFLANVRRLNRRLREMEGQFDVIHMHNHPANLALYGIKCPVVWMCNEPAAIVWEAAAVSLRQRYGVLHPKRWLRLGMNRLILWWDKHMVQSKTITTVVADTLNQERFKLLYGLDSKIIPYGVDFDFFAEPTTQSPMYADPDRWTIVQVGMVTPLKNQMASLHAMVTLREQMPDLHLILAGMECIPEYSNKLRQFIAEHKLENRVSFLGHANQEQVRDLYRCCQAMVHPVLAQGGWLSPFEALAARIPIVVSRELTAAPIIEENNLGVVCDNLAQGLLQLRAMYPQHQAQAEKRAEWTHRHIVWERFCTETRQTLEQVVSDYTNRR